MFDIGELIEDSMSESNVDKKKVIKILSDGFRNKSDELDVYECLYREIYGDELIPEKCDELIDSLFQGEENGAKWSIEETNSVASKLDLNFDSKPYTPEEFRAAMHIEYYDSFVPLKRSGKDMSASDWGRMADFYFCGDDEPKGKIVDYYFWKMSKIDEK